MTMTMTRCIVNSLMHPMLASPFTVTEDALAY